MMKIYRNNIEIAAVFIREDSFLYEEIKGEHTITLVFDVLNSIDLQLNDYVLHNDAKYKVKHQERIVKEETSLGYSYSVTFYADQYDLQDTVFFLFGQPERKKHHDTYNGTAAQVLELIVQNMNRNDSGWSVGACIETLPRTFDFKDMKCSEVLDRLASEYEESEYWVINKTIYFGERKYPSGGLTLGQGEGMGFKQLDVTAVDEAPPVTVLFPYGSDKNLGADYGNDYLVLPDSKIELTKNTDKYGRFELSKQFDNIFPQGKFHVSEKIDNFTLKAGDIDFNLTDCLLDGVEVIVTFQDGQLAGYDLAIVDGSWKNDLKQFKLKVNEQENALKVPGDINFEVGDMFILTGLKMPQSYIDNAEQQLLNEAQQYLDRYCDKRVQVQGKCDDILFKRTGIEIQVGQMVNVFSEKLDINREIRVTAVKKYLENNNVKPYRYEITISDFLSGNGFKEIVNDVRNTLPGEIDNRYRDSIDFTKRRFRDAQETAKMLEDALLNFSGSINPITISTMQLLVGDESLQYRFVNNTTNPVTVSHVITYNNVTKVLQCPAGIVQHMTLGIKDISSKHNVSEYKFWNIPVWNSPSMPDKDSRYLYLKVSKTDNNGIFLLNKTAIAIEAVTGYYHLLVGVLNSEFDGTRSFVELYGFTEVLPGRITTDRVVSSDGQNFLDFVNNAFRVGNANTFLEWNKNQDGVLRIKGTIVQSGSGDENVIGCFRGEWNSAYAYYNGDEVTYQGSYFRYTYPIPYSGIAPTYSTYWKLIAAKGESGSYKSFVFKSSDTQPAPPTGTNPIPSGWSDAPSGGSAIWWMSSALVTYTSGQWIAGQWSTPVRVTGEDGLPGADGKFWDYRYKVDFDKPSKPTGLDPSGQGWYNQPQSITSNEHLYMSFCEKNASGTTIIQDWSTPVQISGENGQDGAYFEYRYAKNGSTTTPPTLATTSTSPSGWTTTMPVVGTLEYLWMTVTKKSADGILLQNWSTPVRTNGKDGQDGLTGGAGPSLVYRGIFDPNFTYYGNQNRVDAVIYNGLYYVTRSDAGIFEGSNYFPNNTSKWNSFGAQFDSVATKLLLAEMANIGDWRIKGGKITSQEAYDGTTIISDTNTDIQTPRVQLFGRNDPFRPEDPIGLIFASNVSKYTETGGDETIKQTIKIDSKTGQIESRAGSDVSYLNSQGVFSNKAGMQALSATTGIEIKSAIVGLGYGNLQKNAYSSLGAICGVFGIAQNSNANPAPAFGGYFFNLMAAGLNLSVKTITNSNDGYTPTENDCYFSCYNTQYITLYFNAPKAVGKIYYFRLNNAAEVNLNVATNGGKQMMMPDGSKGGGTTASAKGELITLVWDGSYWLYNSTVQ
jgi:hypothetical protein